MKYGGAAAGSATGSSAARGNPHGSFTSFGSDSSLIGVLGELDGAGGVGCGAVTLSPC